MDLHARHNGISGLEGVSQRIPQFGDVRTTDCEGSGRGDQVVRTARVWAAPTGKAHKHPITVGAIFVNSWGYDQTNVDAYQVVSVTPATVKIQPIATMPVEGSQGRDCSRVVPLPDSFELAGWKAGEVLTKRPSSYEWGGRTVWCLNMDHGSCSLHEDGATYYCSWYA